MLNRLILLLVLCSVQTLNAMGYLDSCVQKQVSEMHVKLWAHLLKGEMPCYSRNDWGEFKLFGPEDLVKASAQTIYYATELDPEKDSTGFLYLDPSTAFTQYSFLYKKNEDVYSLEYYALNWNNAVLCYIPIQELYSILDSNQRFILDKIALMAFKANPHFVLYEGYGNTKDAENYFMNKPFEVRFISHFNGDRFWDELALTELRMYFMQKCSSGDLKLYLEPGLRKTHARKNVELLFEQDADSSQIQYDYNKELAVISYRIKGKEQKAYWSLPMDADAQGLLLARFRRKR
jgi:hypothetical protein